MNPSEIPSALRARRAAVISAAALSGVLVFVSMIIDPAPDAEGTEMVAGYTEHLTRSGLHTNLIHYGFALLAPAVYGMVALVRGRGAWLANVAGVFAIIGLSTLPGLVLLDFTSVATVLATDLETAGLVEDQMEQLPYFLAIVIPAMLTSLLALPLAVVALWRAGLFPGFMALLAVPAVLALNLGPNWWISFGAHALWLLAVAYFLTRIPARHWYGNQAAPTDEPPAVVPA